MPYEAALCQCQSFERAAVVRRLHVVAPYVAHGQSSAASVAQPAAPPPQVKSCTTAAGLVPLDTYLILHEVMLVLHQGLLQF